MNLRLVARIVGALVLIIAAFMLIPAMIALAARDARTMVAFLVPVAVMTTVGGLVLVGTRNLKAPALTPRDGYLLVSVSWLTAAAFGALPFYLSGSMPTYTNAFFETMSGFTTTGASILTQIESLPKSLLFWRSLTHWLGGMGIVVLTVAVLPLLGIGGLQLIQAEAPGPSVDRLTPRITETAKILWFLYLGFTLLEIAFLMFGGMNLFDATTHTFGTLATGGFSPKNASVGYYHSLYINGVITVFMLLAGMNFALHFKLLLGPRKPIFRDSELKAYLLIFLVATIVITVDLFQSGAFQSLSETVSHAAFQSASILTTTGYATTDFERWPFLSQTVLVFLMFIGGCSGSTGGGIKVIRIVTLLKQGLNEMKQLVHPRAVLTLKISGRSVKNSIIFAISGFFFLYVFLVLIVTLIVASAEYDILTSLTTALATIGNIGPGLGLVGPAENYGFYPAWIKWVLSFAMMIGRLEIYTVMVLFTPAFWRR
ncbi:MAG: potassium transporter [Acidobacteria bacterium CG_4_9_14_3_um_filter_49_7]|nr:MAG: potassium transporter [Acidobacteria bacterium CG_4_9_14_3_um_filter_49_7]